MIAQALVAFAFSSGGCLLAAEETAPRKPLQVTLTSTTEEYVLGEPVRLFVSVKNVTDRPVEAWKWLVEGTEPEIQVFISTDGKQFAKYSGGAFGFSDYPRETEVIDPGKSTDYSLRVLYAHKPANRLAFGEPRTYWIKAQYPLVNSDSVRRRMARTLFDSNTIAIDVKEPEGADAEVWEIVQTPEFLRFLQTGYVPREDGDLVGKAAELLKSAPESSYAEALKYALRKRYDRLRPPALGIEEPPKKTFFPDDARLGVEVTYHFPEFTPLEEMLREITKQSGVPLSLAPELRVRSLKCGPKTWTVRKSMALLAAPYRKWVRQGDGYHLMPDPEKEEERAQRRAKRGPRRR
ncbi:MAG: hypothetical protein ACYTG0_39760 [Planctomycetota bacterium]|jgi:hypothetical protein